jgi:hypothetical protein
LYGVFGRANWLSVWVVAMMFELEQEHETRRRENRERWTHTVELDRMGAVDIDTFLHRFKMHEELIKKMAIKARRKERRKYERRKNRTT